MLPLPHAGLQHFHSGATPAVTFHLAIRSGSCLTAARMIKRAGLLAVRAVTGDSKIDKYNTMGELAEMCLAEFVHLIFRGTKLVALGGGGWPLSHFGCKRRTNSGAETHACSATLAIQRLLIRDRS